MTNIDKLGVGGVQKDWRMNSNLFLADGVNDGASCKDKKWKGNLGPSVPFFVHVEFEEFLQWPLFKSRNNGMWTLARDKYVKIITLQIIVDITGVFEVTQREHKRKGTRSPALEI